MTGSLDTFVQALSTLVSETRDEARLLKSGGKLLGELVADDGWLPDRFATPRPECYAQYLLHRDPEERFSVVSFVWGPGQRTPVHNHTVWGLVGVLRGAEVCDEFTLQDQMPRPSGHSHVLQRGQVEAVSPTVGDWHRVSNASKDSVAVSIHVYGADIGRVRRQRLDDEGRLLAFVSGYDTPPS